MSQLTQNTLQRYRPQDYLPQHSKARLCAVFETGRTGQQGGAGNGDGAAY